MLPQLSIFHIKHHESNVLVIIVKLLGLVAELSLHLDDAVEGLVGDHRLEPDIQLQEGSRVTAVQSHLSNIFYKIFFTKKKFIIPGATQSWSRVG